MKIGIVNDHLPALEALNRLIALSSEHQVLWLAGGGAEAVALCARQTPDLVLIDLMVRGGPGIDGAEAIRRIMRATPCAILVVTESVEGQTGRVFDALGAGAIDAIDTPAGDGPAATESAQALLAKMAAIGRLTGVHPVLSRRLETEGESVNGRAEEWLFAIGTSAGGPAALVEVLGGFPTATRASFVVIQHLDRKFAPGLASWLEKQIALPVRLAREGDVPEPGTVLLPDREDHLILNSRGVLAYTAHPEDYVYRPSVDAFFGSVVEHWRGKGAGVLLTGMGRDGAKGLKKMREAGFPTVAQDRKTSAVYGMPKAALQLDAADRILPLSEIGPALRRLL